MRNTIFTFIGVALLVGFFACDDWTSPEKLDVENEAVGDLYSKRDSIKSVSYTHLTLPTT